MYDNHPNTQYFNNHIYYQPDSQNLNSYHYDNYRQPNYQFSQNGSMPNYNLPYQNMSEPKFSLTIFSITTTIIFSAPTKFIDPVSIICS